MTRNTLSSPNSVFQLQIANQVIVFIQNADNRVGKVFIKGYPVKLTMRLNQMKSRYALCLTLVATFLLAQTAASAERKPKVTRVKESSYLHKQLEIISKYDVLHQKAVLINKQGRVQGYSAEVYLADSFSNGLAVCTSKFGKFGYVDTSGKVVIEPKYARAHPFNCEIAVVEEPVEPRKGEGPQLRWAGEPVGPITLIDKSGKTIKSFSKEEVFAIGDFGIDGYAIAYKKNEKRERKARKNESPYQIINTERDHCDRGLCDTKGNITLFPALDEIYDMKEGLCRFELDEKWGFINSKGEQVIKPVFDHARDFHEGMAAVTVDKQRGYIDKTGKFVIEPKFSGGEDFSEGLAAVREYGKWGFIDKSGEYKIPPKFYLVADGFRNGTAACAIDVGNRTNSRVMLYEVQNTAVPYLQESAKEAGYHALKVDDFFYPDLKFGLITKSGEWVKEPIYTNIQYESDGLRMVAMGERYGYIDSNQKEVIRPNYVDARKFSDGLAVVGTSESMGQHSLDHFDAFRAKQKSTAQRSKIICYTPWPVIDPEVLEKNLSACDLAIKQLPDKRELYEQRAWFNSALNRIDDAIRDYTKAIELAPQFPENYQARGKLYLKLKNWSQADQDFTSSLEKPLQSSGYMSGHDWSTHLKRGQARLGAGNIQGAKEDVLEQACIGSFDGTKLRKTHYTLGLTQAETAIDVLIALKAYDTAQTLWLENLSMFDQVMPDNVAFAQTYPEMMQKLETIENDLGHSKNKPPIIRARLLFERAELFEKILDTKIARYDVENLETDLKQLVKMREDSVILLKTPLDYSASQDRRFAGTEALLVRLGRAKYKLLRFYAEKMDNRCEALYKDLMKNDITKANWKCVGGASYANYLLRAGRLNEIESILTVAMEKYPDTSLAAPRAKAKLLLRMNKPEEAKKVLDEVATIHPIMPCSTELPTPPMAAKDLDAKAYFELARTCHEIGSINTCFYYLKKAIACKPDPTLLEQIYRIKMLSLPDREVANEVLMRYQSLLESKRRCYGGNPDKQLCEDCIAMQPHFLDPYLYLSSIYKDEGNFSKAEEYLKKTLKINPNFLNAHIDLAKLYIEQNKKSEAKQVLDTATDIDPGNKAIEALILTHE